MSILPEKNGSVILNLARERYFIYPLIPAEVIQAIQGEQFKAADDLKSKIDELMKNNKFMKEYVEDNIYATAKETPFFAGLTPQKRNFITYQLRGKDVFKNQSQIVGYLCILNDKDEHIIGGIPTIGDIVHDFGDEYFNIDCTHCNNTLDREYGYRHMI